MRAGGHEPRTLRVTNLFRLSEFAIADFRDASGASSTGDASRSTAVQNPSDKSVHLHSASLTQVRFPRVRYHYRFS